MNPIQASRKSCAAVFSPSGNSKGSGFFISQTHVVTCFHVVASLKAEQPNTIRWTIFSDIVVITESGEQIAAQCISAPSSSDLSPLQYDFALLELHHPPKTPVVALALADTKAPEVGSDIYFSGYPLQTPAMVTHKGMLSGVSSDGNIICIQGPVNKGNSGGALIGIDEKVYGIVSMREGGIGQGLEELRVYIDQTSKNGTVTLMGVDPLKAINALIGTFDTYISTGIGYARSSKFVSDYLKKNRIAH